MKNPVDIDIGCVVEVDGERVLVELSVDTTRALVGDYHPGQLGSHIKIPFRDHSVIAIVSSVKVVTGASCSFPQDRGSDLGHKLADCILVGILDRNRKFSRGVMVYPNVGQKVKMVGPDEVKDILSEFIDFGFSFGRPTQALDERAYIQVDRFFGQHTAVLGATGSGKSCTVVSILQQAIKKYPDTHIVVLDLHGEYASAFPDDVLLINPDKVRLPYWLLTFDEFLDLTVDMSEVAAKNQITVLKDAIVRARQGTDKAERLGFGNAVTVDSPIFYEMDELLGQIRNWNIQMITDGKGELIPGPLNGTFDRFLIRFDSKLSDPRFDFMFGQTSYTGASTLPDLLKEYLSIDTGKRMTVIDLSGIPTEAVQVVAAVVSRVVFEFNLWNPERERFPILLVLEEAHNYVPVRTDGRPAPARAAVERIAKEGRKYGIGLVVVSQRPKELSETVLSQCNTFVAMRLTNPDDQNYVRHLVPDSLAGLMNMLPALRTGEALILGDSVALPTRVMIDLPHPLPDSRDVEYARWWSDGIKEMDVDRVVKRWRARRKDL